MWYQDLQCTLDVADDGFSYPTNAKFVEDELIQLAKVKGLHFDDDRPRTPCASKEKLRDNPAPIYRSTSAFSISGTVTLSSTGAAIPGGMVFLNGLHGVKTRTDANGYYVFNGLFNGTYSVQPSSFTHTFTPVKRTVSIMNSSQPSQDFVGN